MNEIQLKTYLSSQSLKESIKALRRKQDEPRSLKVSNELEGDAKQLMVENFFEIEPSTKYIKCLVNLIIVNEFKESEWELHGKTWVVRGGAENL